ncbi:MAG: ABC transporter permease [Pirellulaceae bacterium]|nr:ABC transporter permease [Pirellulaceae bacterium]
MRELAGLVSLSLLTFRRQILARKSFVAAVLIAMLTMATGIWTQRRHHFHEQDELDPLIAQLDFMTNTVVVRLFVSFLLPILVLTYATAAIGEEREERTLVYTLIRPLARWRIYLAKAAGIMPIVLLASLGGFSLVCLAGAEAGHIAWRDYWPAILYGCLTYTALFLLFGAALPRPVIMAVVYSFLIEALLGSMPGTIKRLAVSYYANCMIYEAAAKHGVQPEQSQFGNISGHSAMIVLASLTIVLLLLGAAWFQRREYRDLA